MVHTKNIIVNGLTIPMVQGIPIGSNICKTANPSNPFWKSYSIGHYYNNQKKVMVYFNPNKQFVIIKSKTSANN